MKGLHTESIFSVVGANDILKPGTSFSVSFISTHSSDMPEFRMTSTDSALCCYFRSKSLMLTVAIKVDGPQFVFLFLLL